MEAEREGGRHTDQPTTLAAQRQGEDGVLRNPQQSHPETQTETKDTPAKDMSQHENIHNPPVREDPPGCGGELGGENPPCEDGRRERVCLEGGRSEAALPGAR